MLAHPRLSQLGKEVTGMGQRHLIPNKLSSDCSLKGVALSQLESIGLPMPWDVYWAGLTAGLPVDSCAASVPGACRSPSCRGNPGSCWCSEMTQHFCSGGRLVEGKIEDGLKVYTALKFFVVDVMFWLKNVLGE